MTETVGHTGVIQPRPHAENGEGDAPGVSGPLSQGTTCSETLSSNVTTLATPEMSIIDLQRRKLRHRTCVGLSS